MTKKVSKESLNISEEKIEELKKVIPEVFTEGKIDFEKLQRTLGNEIDGKDEKYSFNWAGRKETFKNIQTTAKGTLKPAEKESVNWDKTENLFIEGDNLEVLKLLQKAYFNKIKMIYIDPPYNTGKDFVYKDNFKNNIQSYLEQTGQSKDGIKLSTNAETNGRFHSDWISMIYPRLFVARNLLREDGVIFISINDREVHNLRKVMDEIFGEENFLAQLIWENKEGGGGSDSSFFRIKHEYILCYVKDICSAEINGVEISNKERYTSSDKHVNNRGRYYLQKLNQASIQYSKSLDYPIISPDGDKLLPKQGNKRACWRWSENKVKWGIENDFIEFKKDREGNWQVYTKQYMNVDNEGNPIERKNRPIAVIDKFSSTQASKHIEKLFGKKVFDYSKPYQLIEYLISLASTQDDYILDFFAGSSASAEAVLSINKNDEKNRKFIMVQLPEKTTQENIKKDYENIAEIGKERIRRVIKEFEKENRGKLIKKNNIDLGFKVFKLDKSNYKIWEKYEGQDAKELKKQLELFKTPLISGYKNDDVIYECIIKEGYSLNSKIEKTDVKSNKVFKVTDGDLFFYISLDQEIKDKTIDELKLKKENMFICLDEALNDSKKKNLSIQCNLKTI